MKGLNAKQYRTHRWFQWGCPLFQDASARVNWQGQQRPEEIGCCCDQLLNAQASTSFPTHQLSIADSTREPEYECSQASRMHYSC